MLETFKARLKAKSTAAGVNNLSSKRIDAIAAKLHAKFPDTTEEKDHDEKVDDFYSAEDFKEMGAFDDHQRAKAARDAKAKDKTDTTTSNDASSSSAQASTDKPEDETTKLLKELLGKVSKMESEKAQQTISQKIGAHEKLKGVPKSYYSNWKMPEKEEDIDGFIEQVTTGWGEVAKESKEKGLSVIPTPGGGTPANTQAAAVDPSVKAFADKQKASAAQQNGQKV
jgi:hypothetical protein